ncbi:ribbon-helix-helix domain-containing protein [Oricola nitratireducens]|uniref:ribbon-helix-helix domain-containing protein n=1 Tax=Oricola nitratireducens TaxID=2775868 RepID=UPI00186841F0|nr:ribbon-helix-helix domain-containing protein [Oricola nitratireducens]
MAVRKHSVTISGHRTSFSIEDEFLTLLRQSAARSGRSLAALIAEIDETKPRDSNLSSALRVFVLNEALAGRPGATH